MAAGQHGELAGASGVERIGRHDHGIRALLRDGRECGVNVPR
jgi:hypothetical protein